jgi:hypothetical protein
VGLLRDSLPSQQVCEYFCQSAPRFSLTQGGCFAAICVFSHAFPSNAKTPPPGFSCNFIHFSFILIPLRAISAAQSLPQWPRPVFKAKRAITAEEHAAIVQREQNTERRDFHKLLWHTGASQTDAACLLAEDVDWNSRTISYSRAKLKSRGGNGIKPALIRFGAEIEAILKRRPAVGPLFPYLCTVRANDRATEFRQRCNGLEISGVSLHSYRSA